MKPCFVQGLPVTFPQQQARSGGAPKPVTIPPVVRQPKRVLKIVDPTTNQGLDISSVKTEVNKMQARSFCLPPSVNCEYPALWWLPLAMRVYTPTPH